MMMRAPLLLLALLAFSAGGVVALQKCASVAAKLRHETPLLNDYFGSVFGVAFTSLSCPECLQRIRKLTQFQRHRGIPIVVISPHKELSTSVSRMAQRVPGLRFEVMPEHYELYELLKDKRQNDFFVLDGCGQLLDELSLSSDLNSLIKVDLLEKCPKSCSLENRRRQKRQQAVEPSTREYEQELARLMAPKIQHHTYENLYSPKNPPPTVDSRVPQPVVIQTHYVPTGNASRDPNDPRFLEEMQRSQERIAQQLQDQANRLYTEQQRELRARQQQQAQGAQQDIPTSNPVQSQIPAPSVDDDDEHDAIRRQPVQAQHRPQYIPQQPQAQPVRSDTFQQSFYFNPGQPQAAQTPAAQPQAPLEPDYRPHYQQPQAEALHRPRVPSQHRGTAAPAHQKVTKEFVVQPTESYAQRLENYNMQMEERRKLLAKEKADYARQLERQNQQNQYQSVDGSTNTEDQRANFEVKAFPYNGHLQKYGHLQQATQTVDEAGAASTVPAGPPTTRRPPKTTKEPPVYASARQRYQFGLGSRHSNSESLYQQQQRRRNEVAARRQKEKEERQRLELEQLQRAELQRKIAEEQAKQAAALAAIRARTASLQNRASSPTLDPAPMYPDEDGRRPAIDLTQYYDDMDEQAAISTAIPQAQMESPISPSPMWMVGDDINEHPDFLFDLPCNGFTDEICYQQQTQLSPEEVHKCCQTKIVLTDQCVPGKCSNGTVQLCCIQRFLQAKFKCCNDRKMGDPLFATDTFSRCCYDDFVVEDDPCCPKSFSTKQWLNVHELCLPNTNIDLSKVKVPQRAVAGMSTIVHFDFSKTEKWRFECRYGGHVPQYSYFTEDAFKNSKEKSVEQ